MTQASLDWLSRTRVIDAGVLAVFEPLTRSWDAATFLDHVRRCHETDSQQAAAVCQVLQFNEFIALLRIAAEPE